MAKNGFFKIGKRDLSERLYYKESSKVVYGDPPVKMKFYGIFLIISVFGTGKNAVSSRQKNAVTPAKKKAMCSQKNACQKMPWTLSVMEAGEADLKLGAETRE